MEPSKHQQTLNQFSLKIATKFLLPISIFSIILSYPSFLPSILQSSKQLFSYNFDKNYMFLLCNGILVLIVKNSGLIANFQEETHVNDKYVTKNGNGQRQVVESSEKKASSVAEEKVGKAQDEGEEQVNEFLDDDEEEIGMLSIEDLNKKCEEFIRKMHESRNQI